MSDVWRNGKKDFFKGLLWSHLWCELSSFSLIQGNEKRLYEFIVRHFLACCSKDAQGQEVTVEIDIAEEKFSASGLTIIARNYLEVYPYDKWYNKVMLPVWPWLKIH